MPRVKRGTVRRAKRKKLLGLAKGYYANKSKLYRAAKESVDTALKYAFVGRRRKKRDFRRLWVIRINAAAREHGLTYGQFISGLKQASRNIQDGVSLIQTAGRAARNINGKVIMYADEITPSMKRMMDAKEFLHQEFGCKIEVVLGDDRDHPKAKAAMPSKVGILVE